MSTERTLRIAVVGACPFPVPQGSQVFLKDTALALQARGHDVHVVVYGHGGQGDDGGLRIHRGMRIPGARRTEAGPSVMKPFLDLALVARLRRVVAEHRIDVVLAHNYEGLLVALAARTRPIVYQAHNAMADELPHYFRGHRIATRLGAWLDRTFPRRADRVVAPHVALAEYLSACGCTNARLNVLPPACDLDWPEPEPPYGDCTRVIYTGNLDAYQNLGFLHRVMARVRERTPDARLVVATASKRRVRDAEVVPTPDFEALRRELVPDAVVVCPRTSWSGYPIKLLNAMAAGKAIVACRSAAYPLDHDVTGLVVDDADEAGFADAVVRLLASAESRRRLGTAARQAARTHHAPDAIAERLVAVLVDAVRSHRARRGTAGR